ncbi:MAG: hypothetical protein GYB68_07375, partial [Chloroflexi bacterium]|nr:hypothetical protein [Chloroflexota bacterium]
MAKKRQLSQKTPQRRAELSAKHPDGIVPRAAPIFAGMVALMGALMLCVAGGLFLFSPFSPLASSDAPGQSVVANPTANAPTPT